MLHPFALLAHPIRGYTQLYYHIALDLRRKTAGAMLAGLILTLCIFSLTIVATRSFDSTGASLELNGV